MKSFFLLSILTSSVYSQSFVKVEYYEVKSGGGFTQDLAKKLISKGILLPSKKFIGEFKDGKYEYDQTSKIDIPSELSKEFTFDKTKPFEVEDRLAIQLTSIFDTKGNLTKSQSSALR